MAFRPVFTVSDRKPYVEEINVEFQYYSGFAISQQKKSIDSLHSSFRVSFPDRKILEVSTKSEDILGQQLSAFNLRGRYGSNWYTVESLFQSGKVFTMGGPYADLLQKSGSEIKKDPRLTESGNLISFSLFGEPFPLEPKTFFYDWIYLNALKDNDSLLDNLVDYDAFTDIAFNPQKSINCQARTVATFVSLARKGLLIDALGSKEDFLRIVYGSAEPVVEIYEQQSLF